jgi:hypothetical protein
MTLTTTLFTGAPMHPAPPPAHAPLLTQMEHIAAGPAVAALTPEPRATQAPSGRDSVKDGAISGAILAGAATWVWTTRNGLHPTLLTCLGAGLGALIGAEIDGRFNR